MAQRIEQMDTCDLTGDGKGCIIEREDNSSPWNFMAKCPRHKDAKDASVPIIENNVKNVLAEYGDKNHVFDATTDLTLEETGSLTLKVPVTQEAKAVLEAALSGNVKGKSIVVTAEVAAAEGAALDG